MRPALPLVRAQLSAGRHGRKLVDANEKGSAIIRLPFRDWPCPHKARPPLLAQQTTSQRPSCQQARAHIDRQHRSEEHTSELQSRENLVCRLLLEKKKKTQT